MTIAKKLSRFPVIIICITVMASLNGCTKNLTGHVKGKEPYSYGQWEVGHATFDLVDSKRDNRALKVDGWYPVDEEDVGEGKLSRYTLLGPLGLTANIAMKNKPVSAEGKRKLVVFSHGYGAPSTQSTPLMENLASHGFIVVSPAHTGNTVDSHDDEPEVAGPNRVPDISFVIDAMFKRNKDAEDPFYGRIDESEVAVVGNSYGAMTALGVAGGWGLSAPDSRVSAIVPISALVDKDNPLPDGPYNGFTQEQIESIRLPVLLLGGTEDENTPIEHNRIAYDWLPSTVYRVDIVGASHFHFANMCAIGEFLLDMNISVDLWPYVGARRLIYPYNATCTEQAYPIDNVQRLQNLYVTAFLKRHVMDMPEYDRYLTSDYAEDNELDIQFMGK
jgi:predicted dienelactone hydrolase